MVKQTEKLVEEKVEKVETKTEEMNIYRKLQKMRCELQGMNLKKSGKNEFAKYSYYELQDFIPQINVLMEKYNVTSRLCYTKEIATLEIINCEKPEERIAFTSPMAEALLKGCHPVQNLGAAETYERRYLYMTAFEIIEHEALDSSKPLNGDGNGEIISTDEYTVLKDLITFCGVDEGKFRSYMKVDSLEKLPRSKYKQALIALEKKRETVKT